VPTGRYLDAGQADCYRRHLRCCVMELHLLVRPHRAGRSEGRLGASRIAVNRMGEEFRTEVENRFLGKMFKLDCLQAMDWGLVASAFHRTLSQGLAVLPTYLTWIAYHTIAAAGAGSCTYVSEI